VSLSLFLSNFGYAGLILLAVIAIILMINNFQKKSLNLLRRLSSTYNDIETVLARMTNSVEQINSRIAAMETKLEEIDEAVSRQQQELTRLADGFHSQSQMSKAIELARGGASASEIMLTTNLSKEEAEAIARFHRA
jgi:predicted  nucleic acid-binding Zn-ribbon protein